MNALFFIFALLFFFYGELPAKIRILTFHYNKPDFIEWQYKTFKRFLMDDFELIVFNDAARSKDEKAIQEIFERLDKVCSF